MNRVRLLKNQGKRDPEVIPTDWSLTGEKLVSLNLETRRQEKDRDLSEDLGQMRQSGCQSYLCWVTSIISKKEETLLRG